MDNLDEAARRPMQYLSEDGVPDLMLGLNSLLVGAIFLIAFLLPKDTAFGRNYIFIAQILWGCCIFGMRWGVKALRAKVTFPRGGYVDVPNPRLAIWTLRILRVAGAVLVTVILSQILMRSGTSWERFAVPLVALTMAVALGVSGWRYQLPYMLWLALCSLALGVCVYQFQRGGAGICWMLIGLGTAMTLAGAVRLRGFIVSHPRLLETA